MENFKGHKIKAEFLTSLMGKGIVLMSLSMIKYSWYTVMRTNYLTSLAEAPSHQEGGDKEAPAAATGPGMSE